MVLNICSVKLFSSTLSLPSCQENNIFFHQGRDILGEKIRKWHPKTSWCEVRSLPFASNMENNAMGTGVRLSKAREVCNNGFVYHETNPMPNLWLQLSNLKKLSDTKEFDTVSPTFNFWGRRQLENGGCTFSDYIG